ncbi:D-glycero-beta-D-manno-heptose-7-phosphate kinase [Robertmurraya massiliosenegalensis]|uniref:D-glycero-beta-D-manno-heptose-7-phosphate kinase n=1 Tax=Robertmurraya TaxID=2837507 RepID=UPI0039A6E682
MNWSLKEIIQRFQTKIKSCRVLVIGDVMLDQYYFCEMKRISPEAPVPVVNLKEATQTLGGAANVANNLVHLGCQVSLAGVVGRDRGRDDLLEMLSFKGIDVSGIQTDDRSTTIKTRIISGNQQVLRMDQEENVELSDEGVQKFEEWFVHLLSIEKYDAIIISDYGKGFCQFELCQSVLFTAKKKEIPVIIDPKGDNWDKYRGATIVTPNLKELSDLLGKDIPNSNQDIHEYGKELRKKYDLDYLLITRSEQGMSLVGENEINDFSTLAKEVFDVSGAGDTVVSTLGAIMGMGIPVQDAVKISNIAAGIVVGKLGTYAVKDVELISKLEFLNDRRIINKIFSENNFQALVDGWRNKGERIIFTNGCFDLLHIGHATYLKNAKELGDKLIIGLNSDQSVKRLKGINRPVNHEQDRAKMLSFFEFVDAVIIFDEDTPLRLISEIRPDVLVKGGDYRAEEVVGKEYAKKVEILSFIDGYSTTSLIERMTN